MNIQNIPFKINLLYIEHTSNKVVKQHLINIYGAAEPSTIVNYIMVAASLTDSTLQPVLKR